MRRIIALFLCLLMSFGCLPVFAEETPQEDPFFELAQLFTYYHYAFFTYLGEFEFGDNFPMTELYDHGYTGFEAFSTSSRLYDMVFVPDETGTAVAEIHLLSTLEANNDANNLRIGSLHVNGILFPFTLEYLGSGDDTFNDALMEAMVNIWVDGTAYGGNYNSEAIDYAGVADIYAYTRSDGTYAVGIYFNTPVTMERLEGSIFLLASLLEDDAETEDDAESEDNASAEDAAPAE